VFAVQADTRVVDCIEAVRIRSSRVRAGFEALLNL
jgi:hypothetical protein